MRIQPFRKLLTYKIRCVSAIVGTTLLFFTAPAPTWADTEIAPHRAGYTLEIKRTSRNSRILDASGAMMYTWGETCNGWTVEQKFLLNIVRSDGNVMQSIANSSTWEAKDGSHLRFNIKRERDGEEVEKIRGEARIDSPDAWGIAEFELPRQLQIKLPKGTAFPTNHTIQLIRRAKEGASTDRQLVFDGSKLETAGPVSAFILPPKMPKNPSSALSPPFGPHKVRKIHLAFFASTGMAPEPEFEMSIGLQDNGIAPSFVLDYGDYSVEGKLARLELLEKPDC